MDINQCNKPCLFVRGDREHLNNYVRKQNEEDTVESQSIIFIKPTLGDNGTGTHVNEPLG